MNDHEFLRTLTNVWRSLCDHCELAANCICKPIRRIFVQVWEKHYEKQIMRGWQTFRISVYLRHPFRFLKAPYTSKTDILLSKKGLINRYMVKKRSWNVPFGSLKNFSLSLVFELDQNVFFFFFFFFLFFFNRIPELMLVPSVLIHDAIKIISFLIQFKNSRLNEILQTVRWHILWSY